jgi:hypothetical protein
MNNSTESPNEPPIVPIDGRYDWKIEGRGSGTGELRLTEYFNTMADLAEKFSEPDTRTNALSQFEVAFDAINATREFLHRALPGTDIETPLLHLMMAMVSMVEGKRPAMFSSFKGGNGRDSPRVLLEVKASACIDVLKETRGMRYEKAARHVANILEGGGLNFYSRKDAPAYSQILEWRKRIRKAPKGNWAREMYHHDIKRMRALKPSDLESAIARMLGSIMAGAISAAHFNKATDCEV